MAGELEAAVRNLMAIFDRQDAAAMDAIMTDDVQGVDELSRKWMRGRDAMHAYFSQFGPMMSDIKSTLSDFNETAGDDMGVVTLWMEQDYKINGAPQHYSGPMTVALRRQGTDWRIVLVHAVPMASA